MKKYIVVFAVALSVISVAKAQEEKKSKKVPAVELTTIEGDKFNTGEIQNDGPIIISFWATWCKPCILELMTIADEYEDWQDETGVKLYAVSIDDARNTNKVAPVVNGRAWEYDVLLDPNADFKRAMNVNNVPHTFVLNKDGEIVWQHNNFVPGDEEELFEVIKAVAEGKPLPKKE